MGRGEPLCQVLQPGGNLSCQVDNVSLRFSCRPSYSRVASGPPVDGLLHTYGS